ncbi:amino acid permease [Streptomyces sp. TLI_171]|uniref:amino acid permease n=1 Tax=Streptomyces sp. TLI_171 TaxID=1938859 RepID=UPI000C1A1773|nr:amino acid permease [Streptomyces sp. TLI_171]RKE21218.1 amino acid/polyamine/organocation transporter (APC superfamily) [Streptomyces sp. TLI_171]
MTTSTPPAPPIAATSAPYPQQLHRTIGRFGSFAAGFSFISVLTTVFQLFAFGYGAAGPAFVWTWPAVLAGQLLVAACFAELAARHPYSGAIYQWATRLANPLYGWFTGWLMILGQVVVVAAAALALQVVLPALWSGFQLLGGDPSPTTASGAANAVLLGAALIALTTLVNAVDNRVLTMVNGIGVTAEIAGIALIVLALFTHTEQPARAVLHTAPVGGGLPALLVGAFTAAYVMIGFDSAGELSEETRAPRRTAPRTILTALAAAGLSGGLLLLGGVLAAPSLSDGRLAAEGLPYVLTSSLGPGLGRVLLADVAVAVCVGTLAMQTAGTRMVFSMARDGVLPFARRLAHVSPASGMPRWAALAVGTPAVAFLLLNLAAPAAFLALSSTCVALVYAAYALVVGALLLRRLRGLPLAPDAPAVDETGRPLFSLGRWGLPVNALALLYGLAMTVNLAWPRASVYDPEGGHWYLRWFAVLVLTAALALGAAYRLRRR